MSRSVDSFVAWKLVKHFHAALLGIRRVAGFNTDPLVTLDYNKFRESTAKYAVMLETASHDPVSHGVGGSDKGVPSANMVLSMIVMANVKIEQEETPRMEAMKLEQDVRTALHAAVATIRDGIGHGASFRFGPCGHDAGVLTPEKEAGFRLEFNLTYPQGKVW